MPGYAGFRRIAVIEDATEGQIDRSGAFMLIEVTNKTASEVKFFPNVGYAGQGNVGIPIPPNSTRQIPMAVYSFKSSGVVTVVAYGQ